MTAYPPGPKSILPLRGQLLAFRRTPENFLRLARRYGDVVHFKIGPQRFFLLSHPDFVKDVLVTRHDNFVRGWGPQRGHGLMGEGLVTSEGARHRRQRRLVQPAFHKQRVSVYAGMMAAHAARAEESWGGAGTLDVEAEMRRLTLAIVCEALFGAEVGAEAEELSEAVSVEMRHFGTLMMPFAGRLKRLSPARRGERLRRARERLDGTIRRIIEEGRGREAERPDLLSTLLLTREEEAGGDGLTAEEVRDQVMTLFLTGHETTAAALSWLWYLLALHPGAEAALHGELDAVLGGRLPAAEDVPRLRYTGMVLSEVLRLYPPQWMIGRRAVGDYQVGGYTAPAGSFVLVCPYVVHRDPRYFPDPERFDPLRWTDEAQKSRPQYSYFPFGGGPRRCVGEGFALTEVVLLVAALARRWRFRLAPGRRVEAESLLVLRPKGGILMTAERRR